MFERENKQFPVEVHLIGIQTLLFELFEVNLAILDQFLHRFLIAFAVGKHFLVRMSRVEAVHLIFLVVDIFMLFRIEILDSNHFLERKQGLINVLSMKRVKRLWLLEIFIVRVFLIQHTEIVF